MDLAKEVINELSAVDLNGANITSVECGTNETRIAFLIGDIEVFFTARNADEYAITSILHQGQVFDDPDVLKEYDDWVKYVASKVQPIVEAKRLEVAEVAYKANVETLQPKEDAIVATGENVSSERLEEAEERGKKEGFKAARKKNLKEIKALKKKYHIILAVTIIGLIGIFVAIWMFMGPDNDSGGSQSMPPVSQQEEDPNSEAITGEEMTEGEHGYGEAETQPFDDPTHIEEGTDEEAAAQPAAALVELEETFEFDQLEMVFGTEVTWDTIENSFSDHDGEAVFRVPLTITNLSEEAHGLNMFAYVQVGPVGERLDLVSSFFESDVDWSDEIEPGETQETYMHFLFQGDGEYTVEFESSSNVIRVVFNVEQAD